jgi:Fic family protein
MILSQFIAGKWQKGYEYSYFLPNTINHQWSIDNPKIQQDIEGVSIKLGELNSFSRFVPNVDLFIQSYVMKEAVTSSRIEGTKTNIEEAFSDESDVAPEHRDDWRETIQYRVALNHAIGELKNIPLSNRLIKNTHKIVLSHVRGKNKCPGEFRRSQNWIGESLKNAVFVPPSHEHVPGLMSDLEHFLHNQDVNLPHLVKIAIAHYQFETIHPFLDGNGRTGRILIPLYFVSIGILEKPLLYISDFFEKHKSLYYDKLTFVREKNDINGWILFFLQAVESTAIEATESLQEILALRDSLQQEEIRQLGRKLANGQKLLDALFLNPIISISQVGNKVGLSPKSANDLVMDFVDCGILQEITGFKRNRLFAFGKYLSILKK